jgi:hypothetical protein
MFSYNCSYCDSTNKINRELERHLMTCEIKLNIERRKIFKRITTISKDINVDDARDYFMIDDIQSQNQREHFIDEFDQNKSKNDDFTNVFELSNENASVSTNLNDDIYDLSDLQIESSIHSITSTFRIQTYEEEMIDEQKFAFLSTKFSQFLKIISFEIRAMKQMNFFLSIISSTTI